jgi:hypothetical protein
MKTSESRVNMHRRAAEALRHALSEVSTVKVKEICHDSAGSKTGFVAHVEVLGQRHKLACEVTPHSSSVHNALDGLRAGASRLDAGATPVLIAPFLSPDMQALCNERSIAFIDFEGNARISLGEIFIGKRTMPRQVQDDAAIDPALLGEATARPTAPKVYIASTIPGVPELPIARTKVALA